MRNSIRPLLGMALGLTAAFAAPAPQSFAGPAETAFLQQYVGSYTGRGELRGGRTTESVSCRLNLQSGTQRFRYTGRCVLAGETVPLSGTISYSEERGGFVASGTGLGTVVGQKRGNGVAFTLGRDYRQKGQRGSANITFTLSGGAVAIDFAINDEQNGVLRAAVPLRR